MTKTISPLITRPSAALVMVAFFLQPLVFGAWLPRIPDVRAALSLTSSELAFCLLGVPTGIILVLPLANMIATALGVRRLLILSFVALLAFVPLGSWATSRTTLFLGLMLAGAAMSLSELGLNIMADRLESSSGKLIMNTCHGFWSLGIMVGTAICSGLAWANVPPHMAVSLMSVLVLVPALWLTISLPVIAMAAPIPTTPARSQLLPGTRVISIGLFALGVAMTEGAIADWSAIYLRDLFHLQSGVAGLGYVVFAGMITAGRLSGDRLKHRMGAVRLAQSSVICALLGIAVLVLSTFATLAFLGFALAGLGASVGFPQAVTAVAAVPERTPAANVATLSFIALLGFMIGPVVIGGVTDLAGLRAGLAVLFASLTLSLMLAPLLRPRQL